VLTISYEYLGGLAIIRHHFLFLYSILFVFEALSSVQIFRSVSLEVYDLTSYPKSEAITLPKRCTYGSHYLTKRERQSPFKGIQGGFEAMICERHLFPRYSKGLPFRSAVF
jgi:hypothetical protein